MANKGSFKTTAYDSRCLEFSWTTTSSSVANNTTTISWTLTAVGTGNYSIYTAGNFKLLIDGKQVFYQSTRIDTKNGTTIATGEYTFNHGADGKKSFTAYAEAGIYYVAVNCSGSATFTLDIIPRQATITAAPNFNDEENPTITYTNLAGNSVSALDVCISLDGSKDDIAYRPATRTGTSYTFNLTEAEREVLRKATLSGSNSRKVKFYIRTKIGSNTFHHSIEKTFTVINASPVINSVTFTDTDNYAKSLAGSSGNFIANLSSINFSISASGVKGASITSYRLENGADIYTTATGTLKNLSSGVYVVKVTDNRGNTTTQNITKTIIPYFEPTININNINTEINGTELILNFTINGTFFNGSFNNNADNDGANYINLTYLLFEDENPNFIYDEIDLLLDETHINGNNYVFSDTINGLDYKKNYRIETYVWDRGSGEIRTQAPVLALPVFEWGKNEFNFNVPVSINNIEIDYIVEQGTNNGWLYRKWNSGVMECWRRLQITTNVSSAWGNLYTSGALTATNLTYPVAFKETPILQTSLSTFGSGAMLMVPGINNYVSATQTGPLEIVRGAAASNVQFLINYYAIGRWK